MKDKAIAITLMASLAACATPPGQSQYSAAQVGQSVQSEFGTVVSARNVGITGQSSGLGGAVGAGVGAGAGSYVGDGSGGLWAIAAGALIGLAAGAMAEQAAADSVGIEYVITMQSGVTLTIVQNQNKGDRVLGAGDRVIVQTSGAGYQRVLPAAALPTEIERPVGISVKDTAGPELLYGPPCPDAREVCK